MKILPTQVYMSSVNFDEIKTIKGKNVIAIQFKREIQNSPNFVLKNYDETEFSSFRNQIITEQNCKLSPNDTHVIYTGIKEEADYIVTSDYMVHSEMIKFHKRNGTKTIPLFTVDLLVVFFKNKDINSKELLEKGLLLLETKEPGNVCESLSKEHFSDSKREEIIKRHYDLLTDRISIYRKSLTREYQELYQKKLISI